MPRMITAQMPEVVGKKEITLKFIGGTYLSTAVGYREWIKLNAEYGISDRFSFEYSPEIGAFTKEQIWTMHSFGGKFQAYRGKHLRLLFDFGFSLGFGRNQIDEGNFDPQNPYHDSFAFGGYAGAGLGWRFNKVWGTYLQMRLSAIKPDGYDSFNAVYMGLGFHFDVSPKVFLGLEGGFGVTSGANLSDENNADIFFITALGVGYRF